EAPYLGTVKDGALSLYDGMMRFVGTSGEVLANFDASEYLDHVGEHTLDDSWLKATFIKSLGWPEGIYRVGPLARLNVAERIETPLAGAEHALFKELGQGRPINWTMFYHYARAIEVLYAAERAKELLEDDSIVETEVRIKVGRQGGVGMGAIEAPRGTLIHHYEANDVGKIEKANIIVGTQHNGAAIDLSVDSVAKLSPIKGGITEKTVNDISMAVRCYDPCLSCSTHIIGGGSNASRALSRIIQ
ncbi:MAG: nickel-dependent hydrogenase large subunit, partial [Chloroflexi bacterium]|nr:nickel-dependent hydrogenase large subunit [Chloroflexota bacterium]